jgi:hypothetical protein
MIELNERYTTDAAGKHTISVNVQRDHKRTSVAATRHQIQSTGWTTKTKRSRCDRPDMSGYIPQAVDQHEFDYHEKEDQHEHSTQAATRITQHSAEDYRHRHRWHVAFWARAAHRLSGGA